jgi:hypothetical protein
MCKGEGSARHTSARTVYCAQRLTEYSLAVMRCGVAHGDRVTKVAKVRLLRRGREGMRSRRRMSLPDHLKTLWFLHGWLWRPLSSEIKYF